jgi:hypothetical protein
MVKKATKTARAVEDEEVGDKPAPTKMQLAVRMVRLKERGRVLSEMIDLCEESIRGVEAGIKKTEAELLAMDGKRRAPVKA